MEWGQFDLVVFDVDGTLYCQKKMRLLMARDLLISSISNRSFSSLKLLKTYRQIRERLGEEEQQDFEQKLIAEVAKKSGVPVAHVQAVTAEWIERRPVPYLRSCRFEGVTDLFDDLRKAGKIIGILSDYPAKQKLVALELQADIVVSADDPEVNILKPHPRGLEHLVSIAGVPAAKTLLIGDRVERDGCAARRLGAHALIKSSRSIEGWQTFHDYRFLELPSFALASAG